MNGFLFLLVALGVIAMVATLRTLPIDGFRPAAVDEAQLQRLRNRDELPKRTLAAPRQAARGRSVTSVRLARHS